MLPALASIPLCLQSARIERRLASMGTDFRIEVEAADRAAALRASESAVRALEAAEQRLSTWRSDSEVALINVDPAGAPVQLSAALSAELLEAQRWQRATGGAFDPALGALIKAWDVRRGGRRPSATELAAARAASGWDLVQLEGTILTRRSTGVQIEEGGFGKGAGLDAACRALLEAGGRAGWLDLGGQVLVFGGPRWVEIALPDDRARAVVRLALEGGSLATTGNSERGVTIDGRRCSHVIDPRTGEPAPDWGSVSVLAGTALAADCLSTGLYVLGPEAALRFAAEHRGIEVVILQLESGRLRVRASAGLTGRLETLLPGLTLELETTPSSR